VSVKRFTWEDVESAEYPIYIGRLRAAGCPEDKIRTIVSSDIHTLFDQRRLKEAMAHDIQWWRPQSDYFLSTALQEKGGGWRSSAATSSGACWEPRPWNSETKS